MFEMIDIIKILIATVASFTVGILITPLVTNFLYKHKMWKQKSGKVSTDGQETPIYNKLYEKRDVGTPRMGGVVIWSSIIITALIIWFFSKILDYDKIDFISRDQTWIPLLALLIGAFVGLIDDYFEIKGFGGKLIGLSYKTRLFFVGLIGLLVSGWFYFKLSVESINLPIVGEFQLGWLIIPIFILIILLIYSGGVIDGLDGLSGGVFAAMFSAYGIIAFSLNQINLAAFCGAVVGSILAFLWFNIPPARFYMSETGSMALTIILSIVAFMTDKIGGGYGLFVLPIIAFPLLATAFSSFIQLASKKLRGGKKIFIAAPLHHHFEAIGWSQYKIVMRYWIISVVLAFAGVILAMVL